MEEDGRTVFCGKREDRYFIAIEVHSPRAFGELTSQMRNRTLIAHTKTPMERGLEFDFCVMLPVIDSEVWMPGTVVSYSSSGLVFKVLLSSKEARLWKKAAVAFKSGQRVERREDSGGPSTSPTGLVQTRPRRRQRETR